MYYLLKRFEFMQVCNQFYVFFIKLRESVGKFCEEELTPLANEIDSSNDFPQMREFWMKLGNMGLLAITAPGNMSQKLT